MSTPYMQRLGEHWSCVNYVLQTLLDASTEFDRRVGDAAPRGEKRAVVTAAIERANGPFSVSDLLFQYPGVSMDTIRHVLKELRFQKQVACMGLG